MKWSETTVILQTFACYVAIFTNLSDCLFLLLASWTSSEIRLTLLIMRESCLKLNPTQIDDAQASLTHLSAVTTQRYWDSLWHIILKITTIEMRLNHVASITFGKSCRDSGKWAYEEFLKKISNIRFSNRFFTA